MSTVQALTELSHRADEVAAFCRETGEPIQVTHLAGDDLVLMSVEAYRPRRDRLYTFRSRPYIFRHFGLAASKKRKAASPNIS